MRQRTAAHPAFCSSSAARPPALCAATCPPLPACHSTGAPPSRLKPTCMPKATTVESRAPSSAATRLDAGWSASRSARVAAELKRSMRASVVRHSRLTAGVTLELYTWGQAGGGRRSRRAGVRQHSCIFWAVHSVPASSLNLKKPKDGSRQQAWHPQALPTALPTAPPRPHSP